MKNLRLQLIIAFIFALCPLLQAQDAYSDICNAILASDPALKAQRAELEASIKSRSAANSLDNPEVEFTYKFGSPAGPDVNKWDISVSQSFDWPGVYSARRKALSFRTRAAEESLQAYRITREAELRKLLVKYTSAYRRAILLEAFAANVDSIYRVSAREYELRSITVLDWRKVRIERELAASRLAEAQTEMRTLAGEIESLNGHRPLDLSGLTEFPTGRLDEFSEDAVPALAASRWNVEAARAEATAASRLRMPGFSLGYVHETEGREHFNGFSLGVSLPLWRSKKENIAARLLADAEAEAAEARRRELMAEYNSLRENVMSLTTQAERLSEAIGAPEDYIRLLDKAIAGGSITLYQYFYELNTLQEARLTVEELQAQAALALQKARTICNR